MPYLTVLERIPMEYLSKLMDVASDHLKDAQMFVEWATEFKIRGNAEARDFFVSEARERMKKYEILVTKMQRLMDEYPAADPNSKEAICWHITHTKQTKWACSIKTRLADI